jgi:hypothetical protein
VPERRPTLRPLAFATLATLATLACDDPAPAGDMPLVPLGDAARPAEVAITRDAFLAELSPLPSDALLVVYDVEGPGGLDGTLEVMLRPGGWRRENWSLALPVAGDRVELTGTTIQTPDAIYVDGPEGRDARRIGIGALADAWLDLDPDTQHAVIDGLRRMHERRTGARPPDASTETVLGLPCRAERIAAQDVCMWEAAGLPLRASGGGFHLEAIRVQLDPDLGATAFAIPADVTPVRDPDPVAPGAALVALAEGRPADIAAWLHPGLRLPGPRGGA